LSNKSRRQKVSQYFSQKKTSEVVLKKLAEYDDVVDNNKELQSMLSSGLIHILNPLEVLNLFERIPDQDIPLLLMDKRAARPDYMILQVCAENVAKSFWPNLWPVK
jgi:DNA-directed RNA polymerase III subunit RPC1